MTMFFGKILSQLGGEYSDRHVRELGQHLLDGGNIYLIHGHIHCTLPLLIIFFFSNNT